MAYVMFLSFFCVVGGLVIVASNPSPYFGAAGLVVSAASGCLMLINFGGSFLSLILFLIYLGGMLVVFAYSVALASDPYPEGPLDWAVGGYFMSYSALLIVLWFYFGEGLGAHSLGMVGSEASGYSTVRGDCGGVSLLYGVGGGGLVVCGWGLLLTLFVILELTRGVSRGGLRAV